VIWFAGSDIGSGYLFDRDDVKQVEVPKLFIAGRDDPDDARAARLLYRWSIPPRHLELIPSSEHGTDMLEEDPAGTEVMDAILRFLERYGSR
jgi:pimeloyl-ACP methyl ester carboxylesterase